jgi:hypothetical protein
MHRWALVSSVVLGVMTMAALSRPGPDSAEHHHARVRKMARAMPRTIGDWSARDIEPPASAVKLLRPNVLMHRRYASPRGASVDLLLVQCRDARDMVGHYPPVCYPAHGWQAGAAHPEQWIAAGRTVQGMEYEYMKAEALQTVSQVVTNLIILPERRFVMGMRDVQAAATDSRRRHYGAAQLQIVQDASVPPEDRRRTVIELLEGCGPVLDALTSGDMR